MMFKNKYRIVTDLYSGYEVQFRRWYFPFWVQCGTGRRKCVNTHSTIEQAEAFALAHSKHHVVKSFYPS